MRPTIHMLPTDGTTSNSTILAIDLTTRAGRLVVPMAMYTPPMDNSLHLWCNYSIRKYQNVIKLKWLTERRKTRRVKVVMNWGTTKLGIFMEIVDCNISMCKINLSLEKMLTKIIAWLPMQKNPHRNFSGCYLYVKSMSFWPRLTSHNFCGLQNTVLVGQKLWRKTIFPHQNDLIVFGISHFFGATVPFHPCGGGVEYLHHEPASRKRRRNGTKNDRAIA
jgi:hypothetical protein